MNTGHKVDDPNGLYECLVRGSRSPLAQLRPWKTPGTGIPPLSSQASKPLNVATRDVLNVVRRGAVYVRVRLRCPAARGTAHGASLSDTVPPFAP